MAFGVIVFLAAVSPAFMFDDVVFFNYLNNVEGAGPLFYYGGYVQFIPGLTAFALSPLPMVTQAVLYRVVPLLVMWLLYRETHKTLALSGAVSDTRLPALAVLGVLWSVEPSLWANLTHAAWTALLVACMVVIRVNVSGGHYSWLAVIGILLSGLSIPMGGALVVPLLFFAMMADRPAGRRTTLALAATIVIGQLALAAGSPDDVTNPQLAAAPLMFVSALRTHRAGNLSVLVSLAALAALIARVWKRDHDSARKTALLVICSLALTGGGTVMAYVASTRFARYDGGFPSRFTVPVLFCALTASACAALTLRREERRQLLIGILLGGAGTLVAADLSTQLRGPLELSLMKYRFLQVAAEQRADCPPDDAFVFEDEDSSPVVLCRRRPPAREDLRLTGFTPSVGEYDPDAAIDERPVVLGPKPLF